MANNAFETPPPSPPAPRRSVNRTPTNANSRIVVRRTPPPAPTRPRRTGTGRVNVRRPTPRRILFNGNRVSQNLRALLASMSPTTPRATTPKARRPNTPPSSFKNKNNNKK